MKKQTGVWIALQGKDKKDAISKEKIKAEKKGKEYKPNRSYKKEYKLAVSHIGHKKDCKEHSLVEKIYVGGFCKPQKLRKKLDKEQNKKYDLKKVKLRVHNTDGCKGLQKIAAKGAILQLDNFHITKEINKTVKDKTDASELKKVVLTGDKEKIIQKIEELKYKTDGIETEIKKLDKLKQYFLSNINGLKRYLEIENLEIPKAPEGIEYRPAGIMEHQIFEKVGKRFKKRKMSFSIKGATNLMEIIMWISNGKEDLEKRENKIKIYEESEKQAEEYIKQLENNYKQNRKKNTVKYRNIGCLPIGKIWDDKLSKLIENFNM